MQDSSNTSELYTNNIISQVNYPCFKSWIKLSCVDENDTDTSLKFVNYAYDKDHNALPLAIARGKNLFILSLDSSLEEKITELQFDYCITCLLWWCANESDDAYLIVGNNYGQLHFVTMEGKLVYTHTVLSSHASICDIFIISNNSSVQSVLLAVSDGTVLRIDTFPIQSIYTLAKSNPKALSSATQKLNIKTALIEHGCSFNSMEVISLLDFHHCIALDIENQLSIFTIGSEDSIKLRWSSSAAITDGSNIKGYKLDLKNQFLIILTNKAIVIFDLKQNSIKAEITLLLNYDIIVMFEVKVIGDSECFYFALQTDSNVNSKLVQSYLCITSREAAQVHINLGYSDLSLSEMNLNQDEEKYLDPTPSLVFSKTSIGLQVYQSTTSITNFIKVLLKTFLCDVSKGLENIFLCKSTEDLFLSIIGVYAKYLYNVSAVCLEETRYILDTILGILPRLDSEYHISTIIYLVLELPLPPNGYLNTIIRLGNEAICRKSSLLSAEDQQKYHQASQYWLRLYETASSIRAMNLHHLKSDVTSKDGNEENLRMVLRGILKHNLPSSWLGYIRKCQFDIASLIFSRHQLELVSAMECQSQIFRPYDILKTIDMNTSTSPFSEIIDFFRQDVIPFWVSLVHSNSLFDENYEIDQLLHFCSEVYNICMSVKNPFEALHAIRYICDITRSLPLNINEDLDPSLIMFQKAEYDFQLQIELWTIWNDEVTIEEIQSLGLEGIIVDRLWSIPEDKLWEELSSIINPTIERFQDYKSIKVLRKLDDILADWIVDAIKTSIVVTNGLESNSLESQDDSVTLSRLLIMCKYIRDIYKRADCLLHLIQLKSLFDESSHMGNSSNALYQLVDEILLNFKNSEIGNHSKLHAGITISGSKIVESLEEAMRLHNIKSIVANYGIYNLDPRDSYQMRVSINIILANIGNANSINDALEIVNAWTIRGVTVASVLSRALIMRIMQVERMVEDMSSIKLALQLVPMQFLTVVVEDVCFFIVNYLEDIFLDLNERYYVINDTSSEVSIDSDKISNINKSIELMLHGVVYVTSSYFDSLRSASQSTLGLSISQMASKIVDYEFLWNVKRLKFLQSSFGVILPLSTLVSSSSCYNLLSSIVDTSISKYYESISIDSDIISLDVVKICSLLHQPPIVFYHLAVKKFIAREKLSFAVKACELLLCAYQTSSTRSSFEDESEFNFLQSDQKQLKHHSAETNEVTIVLDVASSLCSSAAKIAAASMASISSEGSSGIDTSIITLPFLKSKELLQYAALNSHSSQLPEVFQLLKCCDLVISVFERVEALAPKNFDSRQLNSREYLQIEESSKTVVNYTDATIRQTIFRICETNYVNDGILISPLLILSPLLKHIFKELQYHRSPLTATSLKSKSKNELSELIKILQDSENHILASRVLLSSWDFDNEQKHQLMRASLLMLTRKILGYRDIDIILSIACLSAIPYEVMVRELKSSVPSIQSDFSRLRIVSGIGEEIARLWEQEQLMMLFQGLQINAKWWHLLSSRGIRIDAKAFQSSDSILRDSCIRGMVSQLLKSSTSVNGNLEEVIEYCRQFDIETSFAYTSYLESVFICDNHVPVDDSYWINRASSVLNGKVDIKVAFKALTDILPRINPLDYEKIIFVSDWLVQMSSHEELEGSETVVPIEEYCRNSSIAKYLIGLSRGTSKNINSPDPTSLMNMVIPRLHFWDLIVKPWTIVLPLLEMISATCLKSDDIDTIGSKICTLCLSLNITKDEFYSKFALELFQSKLNKFLGVSTDVFDINAKETLSWLANYIQQNISQPLHRLEIWKVITSKYSHLGKALIESIENALSILSILSKDQIEYSIMNEYFSQLLFKYKFIDIVSSVETFVHHEALSLKKALNSVHEQSSLQSSQLATVFVELSSIIGTEAWEIQLIPIEAQLMNDLFDMNYIILRNSRIFVSNNVKKLVHNMLRVTKELLLLVNLISSTQSLKTTHSEEFIQQIEALRHSTISKLLSDVDMIEDCSESKIIQSSKSMKLDFGYVASDAEYRRREDVNFGFLIAVQIMLSSEAKQRSAYLSQLYNLSSATSFNSTTGKASNIMRRLTARSQFRAMLAIRFYRDLNCFDEEFSDKIYNYHLDIMSEASMLRYLACLAELQENRLQCSPEALARALGLNQRNNSSTILQFDSIVTNESSSQQEANNLVSLVKTWLRDEGHVPDVIDLCKDAIIFSSYCQQTSFKLIYNLILLVLDHMLMNRMNRSWLNLISSLCRYYPQQYSEVVVSCSKTIFETIFMIFTASCDKIDEITTYLANHSSDTSHSSSLIKKKICIIEKCDHLGIHWDDSPEDILYTLREITKLLQSSSLMFQLQLQSSSKHRNDIIMLINRLITISCRQITSRELEVRNIKSVIVMYCRDILLDMISLYIKIGFIDDEELSSIFRAILKSSQHSSPNSFDSIDTSHISSFIWKLYLSISTSIVSSQDLTLLFFKELSKLPSIDIQNLLAKMLQHISTEWNTNHYGSKCALKLVKWLLVSLSSMKEIILQSWKLCSPNTTKKLSYLFHALLKDFNENEKSLIRQLMSIST